MTEKKDQSPGLSRCPQCGYKFDEGCSTGPPHRYLFDFWNQIAVNMPKANKLTGTRIRHIKARLSENPDLEYWAEIFYKINRIPFYCGVNGRKWKATFDWIVKNDTNHVKILEASLPATDNQSTTDNPFIDD